MRIAFFVGGFPLISETFILRQITGLMDLGHEVDIFAEREPGASGPTHPEVHRYDLLARTEYLNMPLAADMEMPVWPLTGETWTPESDKPIRNFRRVVDALPAAACCLKLSPVLTWKMMQSSEFGYQAASLSTLYRLALLGRRRARYDVLHAHFGPVGNNFRFARELFRAPLLVSFHGYDFTSWPRQQGAGCYNRLWQTADVVTVNSEYTSACVRELGCPAGKLRRLPVGLDTGEFAFRERSIRPGEPVRILTVGRLVEKKGHEYAVRALQRVREQHPEVHYQIAGEGPLRPRLESLIRELGLNGRVTLLGSRDHTEVKRLMKEAHIFLLSSVESAAGDAEGQALVLQEAQACGLPVVATRHGPIPEGVLEGRSALLVPERDAEALAETILELIRTPERWPGMGREGREFVRERYDIDVLNRALTEIYAEAARRYRAER